MADPEAAMLARLIAQAEDEGAELVTLRALVEEASELGAERALSRLGLADRHAGTDIVELRDLLGAWRDAKAGAWRTAGAWIVRIVLAGLLACLALRHGFVDRLAA